MGEMTLKSHELHTLWHSINHLSKKCVSLFCFLSFFLNYTASKLFIFKINIEYLIINLFLVFFSFYDEFVFVAVVKRYVTNF
jgi:hypothetical protein